MTETSKTLILDIASDAAEKARLDAVAEADVEAGRSVSHEQVAAWLKSWGTLDAVPRPVPDAK